MVFDKILSNIYESSHFRSIETNFPSEYRTRQYTNQSHRVGNTNHQATRYEVVDRGKSSVYIWFIHKKNKTKYISVFDISIQSKPKSTGI